MARKLQNRLALAQFKTKHGWEDLTLDTIEPKVEEQLRRKRPSSSGDILSDSSSSLSDFQYPRALMSSPLKAPIFSDAIGSSNGSSGHRKRTYHASTDLPSGSSTARKRMRSSPVAGRALFSNHTARREQQRLAQSSPIKPRKHSHFTTSAGPNLSFYRPSVSISETVNYDAVSEDEDDLLPVHSFKLPLNRSSPPSTPPMRRRGSPMRRSNNSRHMNGKSGEEGADLLLYLATSPSPANTTRTRMQPPSTPPQRNLALPSSMMTTPGGTGTMMGYGAPNTPGQPFDFSEYVNITPSPAQSAWSRTPIVKTPMALARNRRLTYENQMSSGSPSSRSHAMPLGDDIMS